MFGVVGIGDDAKLLDGIRRGLHGRQVSEEVVAVASVYGVIVGATPATVDSDDARFVRTIEKIVADLGLDAGLQLQELEDIARAEGQLRPRARVDDGSQLRRCRIHTSRRSRYLDHVRRTTKLQADGNRENLDEIQYDPSTDIFLAALKG